MNASIRNEAKQHQRILAPRCSWTDFGRLPIEAVRQLSRDVKWDEHRFASSPKEAFMPSPQRRGDTGNSNMSAIDRDELIRDLRSCASRLDFLTNHARARLLADSEYEALSTRLSVALGMVLAHHSEGYRSQPIRPEVLRDLLDGCDGELSSWERHILARHNKARRKPAGEPTPVEHAFRGVMAMIDRYLDGIDPTEPAHALARAIERLERLMSCYPRDDEFQHGLAHAVSGLEQAIAAAESQVA